MPGVLELMSGTMASMRDQVVPRILRGRVSLVNMITGGAGSTTKQPTMTFEVVPDSGNPTASTDGAIKDVIMLQAGFSALSATDTSPGGIVYIPEVGSQVMIMHDGRRWVIMGFYTGPCQTARENAKDPEGQRISYNPGIELPMSRMNLQPGLDNTPHWAFIAEPGDAILSKGDARVKVNGIGAVIGANAMCWSIYKSDGMTLERSVTREHRMAGYHFKHFFHPGLSAYAISVSPPGSFAVANPGAFFYQAEVLDTCPDDKLMSPYYIRQRGHIGGLDYYLGHQSGVPLNTTQSVGQEYTTKKFSVIRDAVVQPLRPVSSLQPGREMYPSSASSAEVYDYQVDADGGFRLRAGNRSLVPGGQSSAPTTALDLSVEYSAKLGSYSIRLGTAGAPAALITVKALTPADAAVTVVCKDLSAVLSGSASVVAPKIQLVGAVEVIGALKVTGPITGTALLTVPDANIKKKLFSNHTHSYLLPLIPDGWVWSSPPN